MNGGELAEEESTKYDFEDEYSEEEAELGDAYDECGPHDGWVTLEFCSGMAGGGRSFHTRNALIALRDAIDKDNEERPIA